MIRASVLRRVGITEQSRRLFMPLMGGPFSGRYWDPHLASCSSHRETGHAAHADRAAVVHDPETIDTLCEHDHLQRESCHRSAACWKPWQSHFQGRWCRLYGGTGGLAGHLAQAQARRWSTWRRRRQLLRSCMRCGGNEVDWLCTAVAAPLGDITRHRLCKAHREGRECRDRSQAPWNDGYTGAVLLT